jgi:hypothetical protein
MNERIAEQGIPHCIYTPLPDGFMVSFQKLPQAWHKFMANSSKGSGLALIMAAVVTLVVGGVWAIIYMGFCCTRIEVHKDLVSINRARFKRADFYGFTVHHTYKLQAKEETLAVLGYRFGRRSYPFGGAFQEGEAAEIASALNHFLSITPMAGDESRVSAEQLRSARPADL